MRISDWSSDVCSSDLAAKREVLLETFILFDDPAGQPLQKAVIAAAQRGVNVQMTLDGWGSATLPQSFIEPMIEAGVRIHIYDPVKRSEEHTSELQSLMRISYDVICLKNKTKKQHTTR